MPVYNRRHRSLPGLAALIFANVPGNKDGAVLRLLDANANRAREALRVWEDYARFILDNQQLCGAIKSLRHEFAIALAPLTADAIVYRDTPGDVGTQTKEADELRRSDVEQVVTAAGKRLGEALRSIEEFSKIEHPNVATVTERIRYAAYEVERRLALTFTPNEKFRRVRLYVLLTESLCRVPWLTAARAAIAGGADCIQLREKSLDGGEFLARAKALVAECRAGGVISIINDRPDIAFLSGADGVHVGQQDLPASQVRKLVGKGMIVGVSTHGEDQARQAVMDGADYVGIGPVYPSTTKPRDFIVALDGVRRVSKAVKIPVVGIAGITIANVDEVLAAGASAVAVSSAALSCDDVRAAVAALRAKIDARSPGA